MKSNPPLALQLAKRQLAELVCDAVNLEGINFTLPEVMTLLDGITVGGHKISDELITLNQAAAWRFLFKAIEKKTFSLTLEWICTLHAIAAKEDALKWGRLRDGNVTIAGTKYMPPSYELLPECFERMITESLTLTDVYDRAIFLFLAMARTQFFYDVNKRMGRFIMNALLLDTGFPVINVPAIRQQEFNQLMLAFYESNDQRAMNAFMRSCLDSRVIAFFTA